MTNDEVTVLLHFIGKAYRVDYADEDAEVWQVLLADEDVSVVMNAARHWSQHQEFPPVPAKLMALIEQHKTDAARKDARAAQQQAAVRCDGSRWVHMPDDDRVRPCAACNPVLYELWDDPPRWERYMNGTPVKHLVPEHQHKVDLAPCYRLVEDEPRDQASVERMRVADWSRNRRDLQ